MNQQDQAHQLSTPSVLVGPSGQAVVTSHALMSNSVIVQAASLAAINSLVGVAPSEMELWIRTLAAITQ